jgi:hypothetical protein
MSIALDEGLYSRINKHQIGPQVSPAIPLPTCVFGGQNSPAGGSVKSAHIADITEVLDVEASLLGAEKHFFR